MWISRPSRIIAALTVLVSIIAGCTSFSADIRNNERRFKGRVYFVNGADTVKTEFIAVLEKEDFFMKIYSRFGEALGYLTYEKNKIRFRDGEGKEIEAGEYHNIFIIMLNALKMMIIMLKLGEVESLWNLSGEKATSSLISGGFVMAFMRLR